jgi:hypothetical protein
VGLPLKWKSGRDYCALMFVLVSVVISHLRHSSYLFDASTNREEAIRYLHIATFVRLSKVVSQQSTSYTHVVDNFLLTVRKVSDFSITNILSVEFLKREYDIFETYDIDHLCSFEVAVNPATLDSIINSF